MKESVLIDEPNQMLRLGLHHLYHLIETARFVTDVVDGNKRKVNCCV